MQDGDLVVEAELGGAFEEVDVGECAGGIVGVVDPEHSRLLTHVCGDGVEVGQEVVLLGQGQVVRRTAGEHRADRVDGVGRVGDERDVTRVDEAERGVGDAFFGSDQRDDLGGRVERDLESLGHPAGDALAQLGQTLGLGVAVVGGHVGVLMQRFEDVRVGRQVGVADAEGDDAHAFFSLGCDLSRYFYEEVRRKVSDSSGCAHGDYFS